MEKCSGWFADTRPQSGFCITDTVQTMSEYIFYDRKTRPNRRRRITRL